MSDRTDEERDAQIATIGDRLVDTVLAVMAGNTSASIRAKGTVAGHALDIRISLELTPSDDGAKAAHDEHGAAIPQGVAA